MYRFKAWYGGDGQRQWGGVDPQYCVDCIKEWVGSDNSADTEVNHQEDEDEVLQLSDIEVNHEDDEDEVLELSDTEFWGL